MMSDFAARRVTMVDTQIRPSDVTKFPIIDAMLRVPRERFVPEAQREVAYVGEMITMGEDRKMLEPRDFAKMLDAVNIQPDELVLDIGCGLGYSAAVLGDMAQAVVAVEADETLANDANATLLAEGADNVIVHNCELAAGAPSHAPYDVIFIEGAVEQIPQALLDQLSENGRIIAIFADQGLGNVKIGHKSNTGLSWRFVCNASADVLPGFERKKEFTL